MKDLSLTKLLDFEVIDLSDLSGVYQAEHDGCGGSNGNCDIGCGCGGDKGFCGAALTDG